jgi:hypothetical protein
MPIGLDHIILEVHDLAESLSYRDVVVLEYKGKDGPFEGLLITPDRALELYDGWHVRGAASSRIRDEPSHLRAVRNAGIAYGDGPSQTENMKGPGRPHRFRADRSPT